MLEQGEYSVRIGNLVIDENNQMWLECELRERPFGTLMLPMGQQPLDDDTAELEAIKDAIHHYVSLKFGGHIAESFLEDRSDSWFHGYAHVGDDGDVRIYRSTIVAAVKQWRSIFPE